MFDPSPAPKSVPAPQPEANPARDPLVDRARSVYLYVVSLIALVQGVVLPIAGAFGADAKPLPLAVLGVLVAPAVAYMFGKSIEQAVKARVVGQ